MVHQCAFGLEYWSPLRKKYVSTSPVFLYYSIRIGVEFTVPWVPWYVCLKEGTGVNRKDTEKDMEKDTEQPQSSQRAAARAN